MSSPVAAAAAASNDDTPNDLLEQLRAQTGDPSLDNSTGCFFLEMCEGNVENAATLYREQQRDTTASASTTASCSTPTIPHRISVTTTASAGGRKRTKANVGPLPSSLDQEPTVGTTYYTGQPTGLVTGRRDRGFANNAALLDDQAAQLLGLYDDTPLHCSLSDFGTPARPGAFHETYTQGGDYVLQTRRSSTNTNSHNSHNNSPKVGTQRHHPFHQSAPAALTYHHQNDEDGTPAKNKDLLDEKDKEGTMEKDKEGTMEGDREGTMEGNMGDAREKDYEKDMKKDYEEEEDADKKPAAIPKKHISPTQQQQQQQQQKQQRAPRRISERNYASEPVLPAVQPSGALQNDSNSFLKDFYTTTTSSSYHDNNDGTVEKRWSNASTLTTASMDPSNCANDNANDSNSFLRDSILSQSQNMSAVSLLPDLPDHLEQQQQQEEETFHIKTTTTPARPGYKPDPPGETIQSTYMPASPNRDRSSPTTTTSSHSGKVRRVPATQPGAVSTPHRINSKDQSMPSKVKRVPATTPGAVSMPAKDDKDNDREPQRSPIPGAKKFPAEAPAPVAQSESIIAMDGPPSFSAHKSPPTAKPVVVEEDEEHQPRSQIEMYEPSSPVQRPSMEPPLEDASNAASKQPIPPCTSLPIHKPKDRPRRNARPSRPGAVPANDNNNKPGGLHESDMDASATATDSDADCKKRRAVVPAMTPGAVCVPAAEPEPLQDSYNSLPPPPPSSMDASNTSHASSNAASKGQKQFLAGKMRHSRKPAERPGVVHVSGDNEEHHEPANKESSKGRKMGRRTVASKPGAVNVCSDEKEEDRAQTKAGKFRLGRTPDVVRVSSEEAKEAPRTKKDRMIYKQLPITAPASKPGAVCIEAAEEKANESTTTVAAAAEVEAVATDLSNDPSLDGPPPTTDEAANSNVVAPALLPLPTSRPDPSRLTPRGGKRGTSPRRVISDPPIGMPSLPVPLHGNPRASSETGAKPKKKGLFGFLKKDKHAKK